MRLILIALATTGFSSMLYEIILLREISIVLGSTIFASSAVLSMVMLGLFWGSWQLGKKSSKIKKPVKLLVTIEFSIAVLAIFIIPLVRMLPVLELWILKFISACGIVLPPAFFMGGEIPVANEILLRGKKIGIGKISGFTYGADTIGAAIGALATPFFLIPAFGCLKTVWLGGLLNFLSGLIVLFFYEKKTKPQFLLLIFIFFVSCVFQIILWDLTRIKKIYLGFLYPGGQIISSNDTPYQRIDIVDMKKNIYGENIKFRYLFLNGRMQIESNFGYRYNEVVHIPLLSHPAPRKILVIGCGDGGLIKEILKHPDVQITQVELDSKVISSAKKFLYKLNTFSGQSVWNSPRVNLIIGDGRKFLEKTEQKFDIIFTDVNDPDSTNLALFYTREFYQLAKKHLRKGGIFCTSLSSAYRIGFVSCVVYKTLAEVFAEENLRVLEYIPKDKFSHIMTFTDCGIMFMASENPRVWHFTLNDIISRYRLRKLKTLVYKPKLHATYLMSKNHFSWLKKNLTKVKISTDDLPSIIYAYSFRRKYKIEPVIKKVARVVEPIFQRN